MTEPQLTAPVVDAEFSQPQPTINPLDLNKQDYENLLVLVERGQFDGKSVEYVAFLKQKLNTLIQNSK